MVGTEPAHRQSVRMQLGRGEGAARSEMGKAHQGVHERQLPGIVEFQTGNAFAASQEARRGELTELAAVDEGLQDVLLGGEVIARRWSRAFP